MKIASRIFLGMAFFALIIAAWVIVLGATTNEQRQLELMRQADDYMQDKVFVFAMPLLEEAIGFNTEHTIEAENMLKEVYLQLIDERGMRRRYVNLLERQMSRPNASADVFIEAANFQLEMSRTAEALTILRDGIARTGSEQLIAIYESNRYEYRLNHNIYDDVTMIYGRMIGVKQDGLWGIARSDGTILIPCEYDKVSTFSAGRAIVQQDGEIFAVNQSNNRIALLGENASDFGNLSNNRLPLLFDGRWYRATGEFELGSGTFDWIGMHSNGKAAAQMGDRWGVIDSAANWVIPPDYDGIIMDELGRSYAQGAVFVKRGDSVYLFVDGAQVAGPFDNARPFGDEGYAAVEVNGQWGFINTSGDVKIPFQPRFRDALSFGQHLAAVKIGDYWGFISLNGTLVIEAVYLDAKSFSNGSAPVLTERGWQLLTLIEYMEGPGGL